MSKDAAICCGKIKPTSLIFRPTACTCSICGVDERLEKAGGIAASSLCCSLYKWSLTVCKLNKCHLVQIILEILSSCDHNNCGSGKQAFYYESTSLSWYDGIYRAQDTTLGWFIEALTLVTWLACCMDGVMTLQPWPLELSYSSLFLYCDSKGASYAGLLKVNFYKKNSNLKQWTIQPTDNYIAGPFRRVIRLHRRRCVGRLSAQPIVPVFCAFLVFRLKNKLGKTFNFLLYKDCFNKLDTANHRFSNQIHIQQRDFKEKSIKTWSVLIILNGD